MVSEHELVEIFIKHVKELGFQVFEEYSDWDLVLERDGFIVGCEAKLQTNMHLLVQLAEKDKVHFKIAILPFRYDKSQKMQDWVFLARKLKILPVMVDTSPGIERPLSIHWHVRNLFYYRQHPKKILKLPDFEYHVEAGVPAPHKVNQRNINFVRLELYAREHNNRIKLIDARNFGFDRVPRFFYIYNFKTGYWDIDTLHLASKEYPHIYKGLIESRT